MASTRSLAKDRVSPLPICLILGALALGTVLPAGAFSAPAGDDPLAGLAWRNVGPVNMGGRVADVEGVPGRGDVLYVGSASGGVWKTVNGGLSFQPIFDEQPVASVGDLALAPSNPEVIYVGTGESAVRNSVSFGNGVYRSLDGGRSWTHRGLDGTRYISRILVHPTDPDTVYVGALGSIFGPSEDRGVYRSTDGGESWEKVLYLDERHGVSDLAMDPSNPNILYAGLWRFERSPWTHRSGSEEGGVYRSVDGGSTWTRLEKGLPKLLGRIGLGVAASDPRVVYVIAESNEGTLFRSTDRGESFEKRTDDVQIVSRGFYYTRMAVDPTNENRLYAIASRLFTSIDGGKTWSRISRNTHVDYHSLWIDPTNPHLIWQGQDGGVAVSTDRGATREPVRNLPLGLFYRVCPAARLPLNTLGGGLQDNGSWVGPSRTREPGGILPDDWRMFSFGDAYFIVAHPDDPDILISEYQAGGILRTDLRTRQQIDVSPQPRRNDGGPADKLPVRFNWNAPIVASPHDGETVYFAGNKVFESRDFGDTWRAISPDLTTDDPEKLGPAGGPVWEENTTAEYHCTIISFAESPAEPGLFWAGTDDGNLQLSRDGGATWTNRVGRIPGVPEHSPVSHVEPSRTAPGKAYVAFDRHLFDDFRPHLFVTEDFGETWRRLGRGLPEDGWIWVVREDPRNPRLLYAGTEVGLYASWDAGATWRKLHLKNLPTVAVHDILIHPRENDLILGTHGRGIWVLDDATPLQEWSGAVRGEAAHLFPPRPALRFPAQPSRYGLGDKIFVAPNPPAGAVLTYYLAGGPPEAPDGSADASTDGGAEDEAGDGEGKGSREPRVTIEILDPAGEVVRRLEELPEEAGLHRVAWDLGSEPADRRRPGPAEANEFGPPERGPQVLPGAYTVRLTVDGESRMAPLEVRVDPTVEIPAGALEAQRRMAVRLTAMRSEANLALRKADLLAAEAASRKSLWEMTGEPMPEELGEAFETFDEARKEALAPLTRVEGRPFWSQGPGLTDELGRLVGAVDGAFAAPTPPQVALADELSAELSRALAGLETFLAEDLAALNAALEERGLAPLALPRTGD